VETHNRNGPANYLSLNECKGEELFVVALVELFVVGRRVSGLADDKAISSCFDDFDRDNLGVVDAEDAFNLGEQPFEKSPEAEEGIALWIIPKAHILIGLFIKPVGGLQLVVALPCRTRRQRLNRCRSLRFRRGRGSW